MYCLLVSILTIAASCALAAAPPAPEAVVRDVYAYLLEPKRDIGGAGTNYPGEQRRMTAVLQQEQGAWRIANIESHASKFSKENTLVRSLQSLKTESKSVSANCTKQNPGKAQ